MFFGNLSNVNPLECVSMNNQECKVGPETVNLNSSEPLFYPFSIKTSKWSGSCNNINDPYAKVCVPDAMKNLNIKVFILMLIGKWYKKSWKDFNQLKNIDQKYYCSDYYDVSVNKYGVKCGTSLRFWENKGWINEIDPYGWFQWYFRYWLGRRSEDDKRQMIK